MRQKKKQEKRIFLINARICTFCRRSLIDIFLIFINYFFSNLKIKKIFKELEKFLNITIEEWLIKFCNNNDQNELEIRNETLAFQLALLCSRLDIVLELTSQRIADSTNQKEHEFMLEHIFTSLLVFFLNYINIIDFFYFRNNNDNFPFVFNYKTNSFCCDFVSNE